LIEYKEVKIVDQAGRCADILIDGEAYRYDIVHSQTFLENKEYGLSGVHFVLPRILPLNVENPKETIDRFFKLLILQ
jgi:hypothetical protein